MLFKKLLIAFTASALLLSAFGCTPTAEPKSSPAPTSAPVETAEVSASQPPEKEAPLFWELTPETPTDFDLDADGIMETVVFKLGKSDDSIEYDGFSLTAKSGDSAETAYISEWVFYDAKLYAVKLDSASDAIGIACVYNHSSEDYDTVFLKYENGAFVELPCEYTDYDGTTSTSNSVFGSFREVNDDNKFIINETSDILGTHWGYCEYEFKDGVIKKAENGDWFAENPNYSLTTVKELPVTLIENGTEKEGTLPVGTKLAITRVSQDYTKAYFITEYETTESSTKEGFISIDASEFPHTINGIDEAEYFEDILYAG